MEKDDLYGKEDSFRKNGDDLPEEDLSIHSGDTLSEILQNILPKNEFDIDLSDDSIDDFDSINDFDSTSDTFEADFDASEEDQDYFLDEEDLDTYQDSGEYRSFDGSREYRSFDASLPDASPDEWYHYSEEDQELDNTEPPVVPPPKKEKRRHPVLSILAHGLLVFLTVFSIAYLVGIYSNIPLIQQLRTMYIQTAMSTLNHKWMATAIIPGDIIDDVMRAQYESDAAMVGIESGWGSVDIQELPSFASETISSSANTEETPEAASSVETAEASVEEPATDENIFFDLFWELDQDSMYQYLEEHPEALDNGWSGIDINESGLDEEGTSIETIYGDQVLAINAQDGIVLIRVYLSANQSRGIMAICKDTSQLRLCAADTLGIIGQTAGRICDANDGVLAISGSAFIDPDGTGNGGEISGLAICSGETYGSRLSGAAKRIELRDDNMMYIVDSDSEVGEGTRDACEFQPALIIDGEIMNSDWNSPNPRAVLGQSSRLETMMVIVEGRLSDSLGCGVEDIAELLLEYGCVQALNLDGGTSAIMYYKGEYITRCSNTALPGGRTLPTAWVYG